MQKHVPSLDDTDGFGSLFGILSDDPNNLITILETIPSAAVLVDAGGGFLYANKRWRELCGTGYSGSERIGHINTVMALRPDGTPFPPEEMPVRQTLQSGQAVRNAGMFIQDADGALCAVNVSASPLRGPGGKISGAIVTFEGSAECNQMPGGLTGVTGRKSVEDALREGEERYRGVVQNTSAIILRVDPQGFIRFANQRALEFFGYSEDELIGKHVTGTIVPEQETAGRDLAGMVEEIVAEPDRFHTNANENMLKSGERVWMEWTNSGIYDAEGRLKEFLAVAIDVTDRKRAEEALRESEDRFRVAQELSPDGFTILRPVRDGNGQIIDFIWLYENAAIARLNGTEPEAVAGRRLLELFPGHRGSPFLDAYLHVAETGEPRVFEAEYGFDSLRKPIWFRTVVVRMGGDIAILAQDITARRRAEEALQKSSKKINEIVESIQDDFYVLDRDWKFVYASRNFTSRIGKEPEEFIGNCIWEMFPKHLGTPLERIYREAMEMREVREFELRGQYTDDWYAMKVYPSEEGITVLGTEITARRRAEEALKSSEAQARMLADALEQKNKLVTDFFINISHEFKTPLTILMLGLELLETKAKKMKEGEAFAGNLSAMKQNSYRLNRLVANLLDITKLDAGFMQPKWETFDVAGMLGSLAQSVEPYTRQRQLALGYRCGADGIPFTSDSFMLERIVLNLLSNAIKHTPAGGEIRIECRNHGDGISIAVKDTGEGIPEEKKAIIFDRFSQVDTKMTRASEGTGIGLALTKSLVELLCGRISLESAPGLGSTFTVELPAVQGVSGAGMVKKDGMQMEKRVQMEFSDIIDM